MSYPDSDENRNVFNEYMACTMFTNDGREFYKKTINKTKIVSYSISLIFFIYILIFIRVNETYQLAIKINDALNGAKNKREEVEENSRFLEIE